MYYKYKLILCYFRCIDSYFIPDRNYLNKTYFMYDWTDLCESHK